MTQEILVLEQNVNIIGNFTAEKEREKGEEVARNISELKLLIFLKKRVNDYFN